MSIELKAGPTSLERLEAAVARMVQKHGFLEIAPNFPVDRNGADSSPGWPRYCSPKTRSAIWKSSTPA